MMKIRTLFLALTGLFLVTMYSSLFNTVFAQANVYQHDTISMEAGRTHDVFYSLKTGDKFQQVRSNWDIQFSTRKYDVTIRSNGAQGVALYAYPNTGISGWGSMDTTGLYMWPTLNDSDKDWEMGAFNANGTGSELDYGWGVYNMISHNISGDSLFFIKVPISSSEYFFLKLWIVEKNPVANKYTFKFANLDGSDENEVVLNCNDFSTRNFVGYDFKIKAFVDREPASADWDLLFAKYVTFYQNVMWYPVTGALQNYNVEVAAYQLVDTTLMDFSINALDSASISTIGNNWITLMGGMPPSYAITDSLVYFVSDQESSIWKLVFEYYVSAEGKIGFRKMLIEDHAGITETPGVSKGNIAISPNPATSSTQLLFTADMRGEAEVSVINLTGQTVYRKNISYISGLNTENIDVANLPAGVYVVSLRAGNTLLQNKLIRK
jgi:hypothetical protein